MTERKAAIAKILGVLLTLFSISMLTPIGVALYYKDSGYNWFITAFLITLVTGLALWLPTRKFEGELRTRDGFLIVVLFWLVLSLFGAIPLMLAPEPHKTLTDAMFEAVSGLTTTGATVLQGIDQLPHAMLYYRQQLQFLGGMGIVVLAVAILPMLGIGGFQLYRAEVPGPVKDAKLTPRIAGTAKYLWSLYVGLTVACIIGYWLAGMDLFDAVCESFGTISTGGFSTHDASLGFYQNHWIDTVGIIFMFLGGVNFSLHFIALRERSLRAYWQDEEFKAFLFIIIVVAIITWFFLWLYDFHSHPGISGIRALFNVVSIMTTTGLMAEPFQNWPNLVPILLMCVALIGGCAASTSGGIKVMRFLLLGKQTMIEVKRLIHPHAVISLKFGGTTLPDKVIESMWAFIAAFIALFIVLLLLLVADGLDLTTAFGALSAAIANTGVGIGSVVTGFGHLHDPAKWVLIFAMLAGRLEIFSLLVILTPTFWRD